ncbi:RNA polymerase sigma factor [Roseateles cellulosilyticus]|uniref:RNA polymerase sigma factor n=1 Tax=Pelomonas cellulosilytica TaxID=2906762 RepID=A0ABS8XZI5_9BURK|nr:RNA polymerase sigma factor [Pelomonas sp. P8]MCE4558017.1 RNA polymerase sigma factor [Pelomonas sp. P8]
MNIDWRKVFSETKAMLLRRGRSAQDAEDYMQDAYLRLTEFAKRNSVTDVKALFMKTAFNLSIDAYRARESRGDEVLPEDVEIADPQPSLEAEVLGRECIERMDVCLGRLDERVRQMVLEYHALGMTFEQIARKHGLNTSTVHHQVSTAMFKIAGWMHGWYP